MITCTAEANSASSPVQRIINMLQMMQVQVEKEGHKAQELFDQYICSCKSNHQKLSGDIAMAKDNIPQLESSIKEASAEKAALQSDITDAQAELTEAQKTLSEATSLRTKENKDFVDQNRQQKADIESLRMAVAAMDKLGEGSFLQMGNIATIRRLVSTSVDVSSSDRDIITNFLSESENDRDGASDGLSESSPAEITGILKQMHETMTKDNEQLNTDERNAVKQFDSLKSAKESQMATLRSEIATKNERMGKVGLQIVEDQGKLKDMRKSLEANTKLFEGYDKECKARQLAYDLEVKTRSEEQSAVADTIQILNDDATNQLFKKTFPTAASFLQLQVSPKQLRGEALQTLRSAMPKDQQADPRMDFVALALRSKKTSFTKVLEMIDGMVALMNKEQTDDADKKKYCKSEIAKTEDEKKELDNTISDLEKAIDQSTQKSKSLSDDIKSKSDGINSLDKQVAEMTKQRKEEHEDFMENLQANNAAKDILGVAKARLSKFYGRKTSLLQTKAKAKKQTVGKALRIKSQSSPKHAPLSAKGEAEASLSELFNDGGSPFSFAQVDMQANSKLIADGNKVVNLITSIMADVDKEVAETTQDEKDAQMEYENAIKDSADKRAGEARAISSLEGVKSEVETELHKMIGGSKSKKKESQGKFNYLEDLHRECDWLLKHFKTRRDARTSEIDALTKAKAVLSGADASFLQISMRTWRGLRPVEKHIV